MGPAWERPMSVPATPHLPGPLAIVTPEGIASCLAAVGLDQGSALVLGLLATIVVLYAAVMLPFACVAALVAWTRGVGVARGFGCGLAFGLAGVAFVRGMLPGWGPELPRAGQGSRRERRRAPRDTRHGGRAAQRMRRGGSSGSPGSGLPHGSVRGMTSFASVACVSPFTQG
jgi:hypothetical protein